MKNGVFEVKVALKAQCGWSDMAKAAAVVGVRRQTFYEWMGSTREWPEADARNIRALRGVIEAKEQDLREAMGGK